MSQLVQYFWDLIYPQPPSGAVYGYRWRPGQPMPTSFSVFDQSQMPSAGVYVVFSAAHLATNMDPFDAAGVGTVYQTPAVPSAAMTALVNRVLKNPPAGPDGTYWQGLTLRRQRDMSGFLTYVDTCLTILTQTAAGQALLQNLDAARYPIMISPGYSGNQTGAAVQDDAVTYLTEKINSYPEQFRDPNVRRNIRQLVEQLYPNIQGIPQKYSQLAADMNSMPLYSLFEAPANFTPQFLSNFFQFRNATFTGQNLMDWLSDAGFAEFDNSINDPANLQQGVIVGQFFRLALNIALNALSARGSGSGSGIRFNVRNEDVNRLVSPDFRPPAIGLAHELVHAMHYDQGTAPGYEVYNFTTTVAELMFTGIAPYNAQAVSENAIRQNWIAAAPPGLDASNVWVAPALRNIYRPPVAPETPASLRGDLRCI